MKPAFSGKQLFYFAFSCIVTLGIFAYLFSTVSIHEIFSLLGKISITWLVIFVLFSFAMSFFRTWRYMIVLQVTGYHPNKLALFLITLVRNFFSDLLPARLGTLIYIYLVQSRLGIPFGPAASSFSFAFIYDILALSVLVVLAVLLGVSANTSITIILGLAGLLALVGIIALFALPTLLHILCRILHSLPSRLEPTRLQQALMNMRQNIITAGKLSIQLKLLSLSLAVRCCKYLALYFLLLALVIPLGYDGHDFPLPTVFIGLCSAELAASLPISGIAGFGAYEGAWSLVFQLLGYPEHISVSTSIAHHLTTQIYGYLLGAVSLMILLLPFLKKSNKENLMTKNKKAYFWPKFGITALAVASLTFILLGRTAISKKQSDVISPQAKNFAFLPIETPAILRNLSAKIVYQRPDGLYVLQIGDSRPQRITDHGSHPRWSPDGKQITYVHDNTIMLISDAEQNPIRLATAERAKAVVFEPDGKSVIFTNGQKLQKVEITSGKVTTLLENKKIKEIDTSAAINRLAMTIRSGFGFSVMTLDTASNKLRKVAKGCSASLSPDGNVVTVNDRDHTRLHMYNWKTLQKVGHISSPPGLKFDNQFWSNHPQWLVSTSEGQTHDIFIHHLSSDSSFQLTSTGDSDRADLYVNSFVQ